MNLFTKKKASNGAGQEIFLEQKRKKKQVDKDGCCSFTLYPRSLFITWGTDTRYWSWNCYKETDDENVEVAKLMSVCWLDVRGRLAMSELTPGVTYESLYVVKLTKSAFGWEHPINLRLQVPAEYTKVRQVSLLRKPRGEWFELHVGTFIAKSNEAGEVGADLFEHVSNQWKSGLLIKALVVRPKK